MNTFTDLQANNPKSKKRWTTMDEHLTVESRIAPPALSCPKCSGLLPSALGDIECELCGANVRTDHEPTRTKWMKEKLMERFEIKTKIIGTGEEEEKENEEEEEEEEEDDEAMMGRFQGRGEHVYTRPHALYAINTCTLHTIVSTRRHLVGFI